MTQEEQNFITTLEARVRKANSAERLRLHPQVAHAVKTLRDRGRTVPSRLRHLEATLREEAIEDMFDNMPV